jgi:hypothetical protein
LFQPQTHHLHSGTSISRFDLMYQAIRGEQHDFQPGIQQMPNQIAP